MYELVAGLQDGFSHPALYTVLDLAHLFRLLAALPRDAKARFAAKLMTWSINADGGKERHSGWRMKKAR